MKIIMGRVMSSPRRDQRAGASRRDDIFLAPYAAKILAPSGRHRFSTPGAIYAIPTGLGAIVAPCSINIHPLAGNSCPPTHGINRVASLHLIAREVDRVAPRPGGGAQAQELRSG